jgi:phospholipid/cholesterol/gamma-HCH transport system substrate-binding protein
MTRARSAKIGAFVALALLLSMVTLLIFADVRFWRDRDSYWARFPYSVSGLAVGAPVELWGVQVGSVTSIALDEEGVRVELVVEHLVNIPEEAVAKVMMEGLTGVKFIDLQGGELSGPALAAGAQIRASESDLNQALDKGISALYRIDSLMQRMDTILAKSATVLDNVDALTGAENRERVTTILTSVAEATDYAGDAAKGMVRLTRSANQRVPSLLDSFARVGRNAETVSEESVVIASEIGFAAVQARRAARGLATLTDSVRSDLPAAIFQIREAALRAQTAMRSLEDNPAQLLRSSPRREIPLP